MASRALNEFDAEHEAEPAECIQVIYAELDMDYPAYTMVFCPYWKVKAVIDIWFNYFKNRDTLLPSCCVV